MHYDNVVSYQRGEPLSITGFHCVQPLLSDSSNGRNSVSSFFFHPRLSPARGLLSRTDLIASTEQRFDDHRERRGRRSGLVSLDYFPSDQRQPSVTSIIKRCPPSAFTSRLAALHLLAGLCSCRRNEIRTVLQVCGKASRLEIQSLGCNSCMLENGLWPSLG